MATDDRQIELRRIGSAALRRWVAERDSMGFAPESIFQKIRRDHIQHVGGRSSSGDVSLTPTEAAAERAWLVATVSQEVATMPEEWRAVVDGRFVHRHTEKMIAENLGVSWRRVHERLCDAMERVGKAVETRRDERMARRRQE